MRARWMIDDEGRVWVEGGSALADRLLTDRRGPALSEFTIKQMGFLAVREYGVRTEITFDPATVSPVALTGYFGWAADRPFKPTTCVDASNARVMAIFLRKSELHDHLGAVIEARSARPDYLQLPIDVTRSSFATRWRAIVEVCAARMDASLKLSVLESLCGGHMLMAERAAHGDYVLSHAGSQLRGLDKTLMSALRGRSFREAEDRRFGDWTADRYRDIVPTNEPVAESISALITFRSLGRRRYFYDRLLVPIKAPSGADALFVAVNRC